MRAWLSLPLAYGLAASLTGCDGLPNTCVTDLTCGADGAPLAEAAPPETDAAAAGTRSDSGAGRTTPSPESGVDSAPPGDAALTTRPEDAARPPPPPDATPPDAARPDAVGSPGGSLDATAPPGTGALDASTDGLAPAVGQTPDGSSDASRDAGSTPVPPAPDASPGGVAIPAGWQVVLLAQAQGIGAATCPAAFAPHALVASATAASGACSCSCQTTQAPSCAQGALDTANGGNCGRGGATLDITGSGCSSLQATLGAQFGATPLPAQGGACSSTLQTDPTQVAKTVATLCDVPAAMVNGVAQGNAPAGFSSCVATSGAAACPGAPFTQRQVLDEDVTLSCAACAPCALNASCSGATLSLFQDGACQNLVATLPVDGTCVATRGNGARVGSMSYSAQTVATCTAGSSSPTLTGVNAHTVCCEAGGAASPGG